MSLVSFSDVTRVYGRQEVLKNVTLSIEPLERIGLVGKNGAGKTTIIRLILDEETPDKGQVTKIRGLKIGYLPQELLTQFGQTLLDLVLDIDSEYRQVEFALKEIEERLASLKEDSLPQAEIMAMVERQGALHHEFERLGGWEKEFEAKKILMGLGFTEKDFTRELSMFSGGWIMRAVLARLLLAKPDLLILDEPTNHLDLDSLLWLESYLKGITSALLLVSHDRVFINNVVNKIIELRQGKADSYQGNYEKFLETKALRIQTESNAFLNQQERIKQIEKFIEKNRVRATTARRAQSRIKTLEKMDKLSPPEDLGDLTFNLSLPIGRRGPDLVAELTGVSKSYGDLLVLKDLNFRLKRGDSLALIGPNGRGKSTLIKLLAGLILPTTGTLRLGQNVDIGYFSQFQMDSLNAKNTVLEEFSEVSGNMTIGAQRSLLGSFLFSGDDVFKKVKVLSGGEKSRLLLAKIMVCAPNLLLLDEPTNHLDIAGRQMLEEALINFEGTMVIISHDRHFINRLASSIGTINDGTLNIYPGDYDDYRDIWLKKIEAEALEEELIAAQLIEEADKGKKPEAKRKENEKKKENQKRKKTIQKAIAENEARLDIITNRLQEIDDALSDAKIYRNSDLVRNLNRERNELAKELGDLEQTYEENLRAAEDLEVSQ